MVQLSGVGFYNQQGSNSKNVKQTFFILGFNISDESMDVDPNYDPSDFLKLPIKQERPDPEPELQTMQTYEQDMYQQYETIPELQQQNIKQDEMYQHQQQQQQQDQQNPQQDYMQMPDNLMMFHNNDNIHEVNHSIGIKKWSIIFCKFHRMLALMMI